MTLRLAIVAARLCVLAVAWLGLAAGVSAAEPSAARVLDRFDDLALWRAAASDGVNASIHAGRGPSGLALRLDFDFEGTAGYALAARPLAVDLPADYELAFDLRGDLPVNDFQVKLVDDSGENVWWYRRQNLAFPRKWQHVVIRKRQVEFAWGPAQQRVLKHVARIEFVVAAGAGGGAGSIYISGLTLRKRTPQPTSWGPPHVEASSALHGGAPANAIDLRQATAWRSDPSRGPEQWLTLDFGQQREFGGLVLRWAAGMRASRYDVQYSDDARAWRSVRTVEGGQGDLDALLLPDSDTRYVRLALHDGPAHAYALDEVEVRDLAFGATPNAFFEAVAREYPRGWFPRSFSGQQSYWTIVGIDGGSDTGLLSEDGALEVAKGGFSIEPFVRTGSRLVTWADVKARQSLAKGYLPIPSVTWDGGDWTLQVTALASGIRAQSRLIARYEVRNAGKRPLSLELDLAVRPSQVNPPAQFLNAPGGVAPIRDIAWNGTELTVNGTRTISAITRPGSVVGFPFDSGPIAAHLSRPSEGMPTGPVPMGNASTGGASRDGPSTKVAARTGAPAEDASTKGARIQVHDPFGYASAVLRYPIALAPGASTTLALAMPLSGDKDEAVVDASHAEAWLEGEARVATETWRDKLDAVKLRVPPSAQPIADTLRTALAHLLITRDGPILRPGTRAYARSWIRDGAMIGDALLRLGQASVVADYHRWYAGHQVGTGKIPCCVDARGADPVPENDSMGEFVFLVNDAFQYTGDRALLLEMWPHVQWALRYQERLRQLGRAPPRTPYNDPLYGLLPESISHEGYSAKPMHSYWDDFWALKGYDAGIRLAQAVGDAGQAEAWERQRDEFAHHINASLVASTAAHHIDYLPGAAELGDFDPTSSTIVFAPAGDLQAVPPRLVEPTFERYWREFVERRDGHRGWDDYTPYELRNVGAFVRLGWRDRALEALRFFMADRRPAAWNQWAEVVGRDPREVRFIGDMPHAWVASDFIRVALDLFAYDRARDHSIVLAAGVPWEWLGGKGVSLSGLYTPQGRLSYTLRRRGTRVLLHVDAGLGVPEGGIVFRWPGVQPPGRTRVNGKAATWHDGELRILELPANVVIDRGARMVKKR
jgi:hypothetical protein